jgi:hypothetical protein
LSTLLRLSSLVVAGLEGPGGYQHVAAGGGHGAQEQEQEQEQEQRE